jgi:hypothetical protein
MVSPGSSSEASAALMVRSVSASFSVSSPATRPSLFVDLTWTSVKVALRRRASRVAQ